jgi:hypothetical protein
VTVQRIDSRNSEVAHLIAVPPDIHRHADSAAGRHRM